MATASYDEALSRVLAHEGGYSNHPSDPGGPTNFGITIHDYRRYVKPGATAADMRAMSVAQAQAIYRGKYWEALRADALPAGLDYCVFDYGVNSGIGRAGKVLRRLMALSDDTGAVTAEVLRAVGQRDAKALIAAMCEERLRFLQGLKTWPVFGAGWSRRVREVRAAALAMSGRQTSAGANPSSVVRPSSSAPGKGTVPLNAGVQTTTAGGAVAAGGAAASQSNDPVIIFVVLVATIAVAVGAWLFWRWWQRRRQEAPSKAQWRQE